MGSPKSVSAVELHPVHLHGQVGLSRHPLHDQVRYARHAAEDGRHLGGLLLQHAGVVAVQLEDDLRARARHEFVDAALDG
jgi:hypothetical protein